MHVCTHLLTGHSLGHFSANTQLAISPGQWIHQVCFHLWKYLWLPYSITLLWGTLRARDSSHCKPRGASSMPPHALTAEQESCPPHGSLPTWYTHTTPLHTTQPTGLYLVFIHLCHVSHQGSNQAPGQTACSISQHLPVLVFHSLREPDCCSEWTLLCPKILISFHYFSIRRSNTMKISREFSLSGTFKRELKAGIFLCYRVHPIYLGYLVCLHYHQWRQKNQEVQIKTLQPLANSVLQALFNQQVAILLQCVRSYWTQQMAPKPLKKEKREVFLPLLFHGKKSIASTYSLHEFLNTTPTSACFYYKKK